MITYKDVEIVVAINNYVSAGERGTISFCLGVICCSYKMINIITLTHCRWRRLETKSITGFADTFIIIRRQTPKNISEKEETLHRKRQQQLGVKNAKISFSTAANFLLNGNAENPCYLSFIFMLTGISTFFIQGLMDD